METRTEEQIEISEYNAREFMQDYRKLSKEKDISLGVSYSLGPVAAKDKNPTQEEISEYINKYATLKNKYGMDLAVTSEFVIIDKNKNIIFNERDGMEGSLATRRIKRMRKLKGNIEDGYDYGNYQRNKDFWEKGKLDVDDDKIVDFVFSKETGPLVYCLDKPLPMRMALNNDMTYAVAEFKRAIPKLVEQFNKATIFGKIVMILSLKKYSEIYFYIAYRGIVKYMIDPEYWSPQGKEFRRCMLKYTPKDIAEFISCIVEDDSAYKYRIQDGLGELDKEKLRQNPRKELYRILSLMVEREFIEKDRKVWFLLRLGLKIGMLWPPFKRKVVGFLEDLDLEKIKLSKEDIFWSNRMPTYNFRGLKNSQRLQENKIKYNQQVAWATTDF